MPKERASIPVHVRPVYDEIVGLIDAVCKEHLNDEYAEMCHRLTAALARKRPSPLARGKLPLWACGIVYTIGKVNFLFDKTQTPHLRSDELCRLFGVSPASGSAKSTQIHKMFKMYPFDPSWTLPSKAEENPMIWLLSVNGFMMDIRDAPIEAQKEAFRNGLIPYIPGERKDVDEDAE